MIPFLTAYSTNSAIECSLSLNIILLRCVSAVFTEMFRTTATSLHLLPPAKSCNTSRSRGVNWGTLAVLGRPVARNVSGQGSQQLLARNQRCDTKTPS
jgi:hypothetical protein